MTLISIFTRMTPLPLPMKESVILAKILLQQHFCPTRNASYNRESTLRIKTLPSYGYQILADPANNKDWSAPGQSIIFHIKHGECARILVHLYIDLKGNFFWTPCRLLSLDRSIMSAIPDSLSAGSKKTENTFSRFKRKRNEKKLSSEEILSRSNCASDERNNLRAAPIGRTNG